MKNSKKTLLSLFIVCLLGSYGSKSQADISAFDLDFNAIPACVGKFDSVGCEPISNAREALLKSEGACAVDGADSDIGHMIWDNKTYYVTGVEYQSAAQCAESDRLNINPHYKSKTLPNGGICELFLYDDKLKLLTRQKVKLPDIAGGSWCNGSFALGRATKSMDAILYSLMYYRVNDPIAGSIKAIGTGWIRSTYLFQLKKNASGKPYFEQDNSCLGSPNHYATIPDARKALAQCETK